MKKQLWYLVLFALILSTLMPATALAATHQVASAAELTTLLSDGTLADGDTIELTVNIDYTSSIDITGMDITFDVGEHTLAIANTAVGGIALEVGPGGTVRLDATTGALNVFNTAEDGTAIDVDFGGRVLLEGTTGTLNVVTSGDNSYAVYAHDGGAAAVSSVRAIADGSYGAVVDGSGSAIAIAGDITVIGDDGATGIYARNGGEVEVGGDVLVDGEEVYGARYDGGGSITIDRSLSVMGQDCMGVDLDDGGGFIQVDGGISVVSSNDICIGVNSDWVSGDTEVKAHVSVSGENSIGVLSSMPTGNTVVKVVQVDGSVSAAGDPCTGVRASGPNCSAEVSDDVSAQGEASIGIAAYNHAASSAGGDITVTGTNGIGAVATENAVTTVEGAISAPAYVGVNLTPPSTYITKTKEEGVPGTGAHANYLVYTDTTPPSGSVGTGTVYVRSGGEGSGNNSSSNNSSDSNSGDRTPRTLTETTSGITVSGPGIRAGTTLIIRPLSLDGPGQSPGCDAIRRHIVGNDLTVLFGADLSLSRSFSGGVTITIPVGTQYDGQILTLLHYHDGVLETFTAVVADGQAVFTLRGLSPVALVADAAAVSGATGAAKALDNIPVTGDKGSTLIWWLLCGVSAAGIAALIMLRKGKTNQQ